MPFYLLSKLSEFRYATSLCPGHPFFHKYIRDAEVIPCPICGGHLFVRNTCYRKVRDENGHIQQLNLRVLQCEKCKKTHRELLQGLIPYKRYSLEAICHIAEQPQQCETEPSVRAIIMHWLAIFLTLAGNIKKSTKLQGMNPSEPSGNSLQERLTYFVRLVVNSGFWIQHRSVVNGS